MQSSKKYMRYLAKKEKEWGLKMNSIEFKKRLTL